MKHALIQDNRIVDLVPKQFPIHKDMKWITVPDSVQMHTHYYDKDTKTIQANPLPPEKTIDELLADKLLQLKEFRKIKEEGGFILNGMAIHSDRDSQSMILGARVAANADPEYTVRWKTANGWVLLNATQIKVISDAVRKHVEACFKTEYEHDVIIRNFALNNERTGLMNYTFEEGWPV